MISALLAGPGVARRVASRERGADMKRVLEPEIIDEIEADHPWAIRSRRDLRMINFLMGNERWIRRCVRRFPAAAEQGIVELGAGGGRLLSSLARLGPATGFDLVSRPPGLARQAHWVEGDVHQRLDELRGGVLVASLFLHHLDEHQLAELGRRAREFRVLVFAEPHRSEDALWMGERILPLVGEATRHDMLVSIRAGFREGELPVWLGLGDNWRVREQSQWRGGHRMLAWRDSG